MPTAVSVRSVFDPRNAVPEFFGGYSSILAPAYDFDPLGQRCDLNSANLRPFEPNKKNPNGS